MARSLWGDRGLDGTLFQLGRELGRQLSRSEGGRLIVSQNQIDRLMETMRLELPSPIALID